MAEERARFCDSCNAVIGWYATFCDDCGMRVGAAEGGPAAQPVAVGVKEASSAEQDLYRAHLRLIHRSREQAERLRKDCDRIGKALNELEARPKAEESRNKTIALSERLLDLEEDWEELQHHYNRQSEGIEEDFLSRIDELEADLELVPHHQEAIEEELGRMMEALEEGAEQLKQTGRVLEIIRARQNSGLLAFGGTRSATAAVGAITLLLGLGGAAYGLLIQDRSAAELAPVVGPALLGLVVLFLHVRARPF